MNPVVRQSHWPILGIGWAAVMYWTADRYQNYLRGEVRVPQRLLCTPEQTELAYCLSANRPPEYRRPTNTYGTGVCEQYYDKVYECQVRLLKQLHDESVDESIGEEESV